MKAPIFWDVNGKLRYSEESVSLKTFSKVITTLWKAGWTKPRWKLLFNDETNKYKTAIVWFKR